MVRHNYREIDKGGVRSRIMAGADVIRKEFMKTVVRVSKMPNSKSRSGCLDDVSKSNKKTASSQPQPHGKKKVIKDMDDSFEESSSSNDTDSDQFSEYEPPSPKRVKHSQTTSTSNRKKENKRKPSTEEEWSEDEFCVEKIIDMKRDKNGKRFFLIKWLNYPSSQNTWEPIENLEKCPDIVEDFLEKYSKSNHTCTKKKSSSTENRDPVKKLQRASAKEIIRNNVIRENGTYPKIETKDIKISIVAPVQKIVDLNITASQKQKNEQIEGILSEDTISKTVQESSKPATDTYIEIPHSVNLFFIRIIDVDGQLNWVYVDMRDPFPDPNIYYKCVVTEDLTGKQPKFIYGGVAAENGEKFCLVQFENCSYVEVIPPDNFFLKFPTFKKFFELHCPHIFNTSC